MMDFPSGGSVTVGTIVTFPNGQAYRWNGGQWDLIGTGITANMTARARNKVNNPTTIISQENGSTVMTATATYVADQWFFVFSGIVSAGQRSSAMPVSPDGTGYAAVISATTAKGSLAATDSLRLVLPIEGYDVADLQWGTANAKPAVLRFNAYCDTAGTYGFTINNSANDRCFCGSFNIPATQTWYTFSFPIPGDATGTWLKDSSIGVKIHFSLANGTTYQGVAGWNAGLFLGIAGQSNGAAIANRGLYVTDVGFYADPDNTGIAPPFVVPAFEDELARAQRYWRLFDSSFAGYLSSAGTVQYYYALPVLMRATPSMNKLSDGANNNLNAIGHVPQANRGVVDQFTFVAAGNGSHFNGQYTLSARML